MNFLGVIDNGKFIGGVLRKPTLEANIRIVTEEELNLITGVEGEGMFKLGVSPLYNNKPIYVDINELCSNHLAIFGNTGSGKTYGICRIIQNIFPNSQTIPYKANLFIFDSYGEYMNAFKDLHLNNEYYSFKVITTSPKKSYEKLNIPVCLLELEDILNLLKEKREQDKIMNTTLSGPHRDRIIYMRNGKPFINYASTGQCRLISLLLRVSQAVYYTRITNSKPVLLMDDVLLELDPEKRQKLTSMLPEYDQLFCTFLPGEPYENYKRSTTRIYKIKDGEWYE